MIKKAIIADKYFKYTKEVNYYYYLQWRDKYKDQFKVIFPTSPTISRIHNYTLWSNRNEAGLINSGIMMYSQSQPQYWGKDLGSVFVSKRSIIDKVLDIDRIDIEQTIIEEVSASLESDGSKHSYITWI